MNNHHYKRVLFVLVLILLSFLLGVYSVICFCQINIVGELVEIHFLGQTFIHII